MTTSFDSMMSSKSDDLVQSIITFHQESNSSGILKQMESVITNGSENDKLTLKSLLWPVPTNNDFEILSNFIESRDISKNIYSVGCGTGLLEYLLLEYLNQNPQQPGSVSVYKMTGIEIDSLWWRSKYAPPLFLPVLYVNENFSSEETFGEKNSLVMFSYFNCLKTFAQYLTAFQGSYVAIIGPVQKYSTKSIKQFCTPNPLDLRENSNLPTQEWSLVLFQRFGLTEVDYVGVYSRVAFM